MSATMEVRVHAATREAEDILSFDLRPVLPMQGLPPFTAGSHVDLHLPGGMVRSYSLMNDPREAHRYLLAVFKDPGSLGGSRHLHERVRAGDVLTIGAPRNNFALDERAAHSVFIAGGIGITALWSMIQRLQATGGSWELHYACRSRRHAALLDRLQDLASAPRRLHLSMGDDPLRQRLDLAGIVRAAPPGAHFYCCGPLRMLEAFQAAARDLPSERVHMEYFSATREAHTAGGFSVELAKSGLTLDVKAGDTILDVLLDAGVMVPYSCRQGTCGCCEVKVIDGVPDHRDQILSPAEQDANTSLFVCCSGARTPRLVLDL